MLNNSQLIRVRYGNASCRIWVPRGDHLHRVIAQTQRFYEEQMLRDIERRISPGGTFVDIGANIGNHSLFFAMVCKAERVLSFEPNLEAFNLLEKNIRENDLESVIVPYRIALGNSRAVGDMVIPDSCNLGTARFMPTAGGSVHRDTLTAILEGTGGIRRIDVVKIDVEGMEDQVIEGGYDVIKEFRPVLYVEAATAQHLDRIAELLGKLGYEPSSRFNSTPTYRFEPGSQKMMTVAGHRRSHRKGVTFFAGDGGNVRFLKEIIPRLRDSGFETSIARSSGDKQEVLLEQMQNSDICWFEWANGPIVAATRLPKVSRIVCRLHRYELYSNAPRAIDWTKVDDLVFVSPFFLEEFKRLHYPDIERRTRVHVIPNGVDVSSYRFRERHKGFEIGYIARIHADKNPALMLQVMAKLARIDKRYRCHVIGHVQDQAQWDYLQHMIQKLDLEDHVIYEGEREDVPTWLDGMNYLLSTSIVESQGVAIVEAMASGVKPVIHSFVGQPEAMFGEEFVWSTVDEAVAMITSDVYQSGIYRQIVEKKYRVEDQVRKIEAVLRGPTSSILQGAHHMEHRRREAEWRLAAAQMGLQAGEAVLQIGADSVVTESLVMLGKMVSVTDDDEELMRECMRDMQSKGLMGAVQALQAGRNGFSPPGGWHSIVVARTPSDGAAAHEIVTMLNAARRLVRPGGDVQLAIEEPSNGDGMRRVEVSSEIRRTVGCTPVWKDVPGTRWSVCAVPIESEERSKISREVWKDWQSERSGGKKVSVIIPTFNRADYLAECLSSVFAQTYTDVEVIVVDDGSTDHTRDVLTEAQSRGAIVIRQANRGKAAAVNEALKVCTGEYVVVFDDDDVMLPRRLEVQADFLGKNRDVALVYSGAVMFTDRPHTLKGWFPVSVFSDQGELLRAELRGNVFHAATVMFRRSAARDKSAMDTRLTRAQDYDLWLRMLLAGRRAVGLDVWAAMQRAHGGTRGTASERIPIEEVVSKTLEYEKKIFRKLDGQIQQALMRTLPASMDSEKKRILATLERSVILAQRGLFDLVLRDLHMLKRAQWVALTTEEERYWLERELRGWLRVWATRSTRAEALVGTIDGLLAS